MWIIYKGLPVKSIRFRTTISAVLLLIYLSLTACTADDRNLRTESVQTADYRYIASHIDSSRIRDAIEYFSSLGSRVIGYTGEDSIGLFHADQVRLTCFEIEGGMGYRIHLRAWLAPYDMGVSEEIDITTRPLGEYNTYQIDLEITRLNGNVDSWQRVNRRFLNTVRKQFLIWRTIDKEAKQLFKSRGEAMLGDKLLLTDETTTAQHQT